MLRRLLRIQATLLAAERVKDCLRFFKPLAGQAHRFATRAWLIEQTLFMQPVGDFKRDGLPYPTALLQR